MTDPTWNNTTLVTGDDVAGQIAEIKAATDGDITISGSATTVRWLLANGLLDELRLLVHPIAVGSGQHLFEDRQAESFELVHQEVFGTGVLNLSYVPAK